MNRKLLNFSSLTRLRMLLLVCLATTCLYFGLLLPYSVPTTLAIIDVPLIDPLIARNSLPHTLKTFREKDDPCHGYDGVLLIQQGDRSGAAATIFFLFCLNQLIYADRYNLLPVVHLNDFSHWVYDPGVHGTNNSPQQGQTISMLQGMQPSKATLVDPATGRSFLYPGRPVQRDSLQPYNWTVKGTGVWNSYFEPPVSDFGLVAQQAYCRDKPLVTLPPAMILPALHIHCPWAVRAWRYGGLPPVLQETNVTFNDWLGRHRRNGAAVVRKYYRWNAALLQAADAANPVGQTCLALHVRHSDKGNRRHRIPLPAFLPFVQAYIEQTRGAVVYLATDSSSVLQKINQTWPEAAVQRIRTLDSSSSGSHDAIIRSPNKTAVFKLGRHHQTNFQVLTDIAAMSRCQFLLHGLSAVSEAVHYWNYPTLHEQSVNLEDPQHMSIDNFRDMVQRVHSVQE
jgi:hypothetical protein